MTRAVDDGFDNCRSSDERCITDRWPNEHGNVSSRGTVVDVSVACSVGLPATTGIYCTVITRLSCTEVAGQVPFAPRHGRRELYASLES